MPNATVRANARTLPEATSRRSVLGAILAAGAVAVPTLPSFAAVETPALSAVDRRVLDLWNRRRRLRAALDHLSERIDAAEAQLPEWARSGQKYVLAKGEMQIPGVTHSAGDVGWPEVADLEQRPPDALGWILVRPNVEDLYAQFQANCRARGRKDGTRRLLQALLTHDARVKEQDAERDRVGYNRLSKRSETGWNKVIDIEKVIGKHAEASILALAANLVIGIQADDDEDDVLQTYRASLRAIRPQLVGAIAEDADRVLPENEEDA
jgi:hypothetical protein